MNSSTDTNSKAVADSHKADGKLQKATSFQDFALKIQKLPNYAQLALLLVVAGLSLALVGKTLGFVGSFFSEGAKQSGPAYQLPTPTQEASPNAATTTTTPPTPDQRQQLWETVGIQYRNLTSRISDTDDISRQVMAQSLRQSANTKCAALGPAQCRSDFQYLMREFLVKYQQFQTYITALESPPPDPTSKVPPNPVPVQKMVLNADTIQNYRRIRDELLDLASALSSVGGDTPQFTLTVDLNKSLQDFAASLQNYETLRQQAATSSYNSQPGTTAAPSPAPTQTPSTP